MDVNQTKQTRSRILAWVINLSGVLIFVLILYLGGIEAWQQIVQGDWSYVLAALAAALLWNLVAAFRWSLITRQVAAEPAKLRFRYYFTYHMIGMAIGQVVPISVGMLGGRPAALSLSRGVSLKRAALSVFLDKLFDLILALLLSGPVALYLVGWIDLRLALGLMGGLALVGALLIGWRFEQVARWLGKTASRLALPLVRVPVIGHRLVRRLPQQLDRLAAETLLPNGSALQVFLLTLVMYALLSARSYYITQALRLPIPWHLLTMGVSITQLAIVFSVTPGSLGFLEAGWAAVLAVAGLSLEQFTVFVLGRRAYVLVFTLIITLLAFIWIRESPARLFRAVIATSRQPGKEPQPSSTELDSQNGSPSLLVK